MKRWRKILGLVMLLLLTFAAGYFAARVTAASGFSSHASIAAPTAPSDIKAAIYPEPESSAYEKPEIAPEEITLPTFYSYDHEPQIGDNYSVSSE